MIDLHSHILPRVDDGSYSLEESLRMARLSVKGGVTEIVATPHCNVPDSDAPLWADEVRERVRRLNAVLQEERIPLQVHPGMEIFGLPNTPELLRRGRLMPLCDSRYPLVEFPFHHYGREALQLLRELRKMGYRPLVAHPERYEYVQRDPELINQIWEMGCLLQINRGSLFGRFGPGAERIAWQLLERGFVCAVASDAHRSTVRTPWMEDVRQLLCGEFSPQLAERLLCEQPRQILRNEMITLPEPDWF